MARLLAVVLVALLGGCTEQVEPAGRSAVAPAHERGRALYNARCYFCHGYSGDARTLAAAALHPPPRNFRGTSQGELSIAQIEQAMTEGRPGTAMKRFSDVLQPDEIAVLARFVHREFIIDKAANTRYHTAENGWPDHERYREAFPFATGERATGASDAPPDAPQARGWRLFLSACVTCHEPATGRDVPPVFRAQPATDTESAAGSYADRARRRTPR